MNTLNINLRKLSTKNKLSTKRICELTHKKNNKNLESMTKNIQTAKLEVKTEIIGTIENILWSIRALLDQSLCVENYIKDEINEIISIGQKQIDKIEQYQT